MRTNDNYLEDIKGAGKCLVDGHHCTRVIKFPTVVERGENCHKLSLGEKLISILHHLDLIIINNKE